MRRGEIGTRILLVVFAVGLACDRGRVEDVPVAKQEEIASPGPEPRKAQTQPGVGEAAGTPSQREASPATPPDAAVQSPPKAARPKDPLEALAQAVPPSETPSKEGWKHLKAKRYAEAQPYFAQAALKDRDAWKHPYNLACAAALAEDEARTRLGLEEAIFRNALSVADKARRDSDLASMRSKAWFEPVLRGEEFEVSPPDPAGSPEVSRGGQPEPKTADLAELRAGPLTPSPGSVKPLSKSVLATVKAELEVKHGVAPIIRGSVAHGSAGDRLAWVVYEFTRYDECLKTSGKKACRKKLRGDPDDESSNEMQCTRQWLVRAELGEELGLDEPQPILKDACSIGKVRRMEAADFDLDGIDEVIVDVTWRRDTTGFREGDVEMGGRFARILRLDGSSQFELEFDWYTSDMGPSPSDVERFEFRDTDRDGHPDLIVETVALSGMLGPSFDDEAFPDPDTIDEQEEGTPLDSATWRYLPKSDTWQASAP